MFFSKFSLRAQILLVISISVLVIAVAISVLLSMQQRQDNFTRYATRLTSVGNLVAAEFEDAMVALEREVLFLAGTPPIEGIIRASQNGGIDPVESTNILRWESMLQTIFSSVAAVETSYFQIRFIGVADGGRELVRVDSNASGLTVVEDVSLQQKGDRDYFLATRELQEGEVYFSEIDLNKENGSIELPHRPALRAATPIYTPEGEFFGIVVINRDMGITFSTLAENLRLHSNLAGIQTYIANSNGDYLIHPDSSREFGFEFGQSFRWQDDFAELIDEVEPRKLNGPLLEEIRGINLESTSFGPLYVQMQDLLLDPNDSSNKLKVILAVPKAVLDAPVIESINNFLIFSSLTGVSILLLMIWFLSRQLSPVTVLSEAARRISAGDYEVKMPLAKSKEIARLSSSLTVMQEEISRREMKLRESEVRANLIIQAVPQGILIVDELGRIHQVNSNAEEMLGYAPGGLIGVRVEQLVPNQTRTIHGKLRAEYFSSPQPRQMGDKTNLKACRKDGSEFSVEIGLSPIKYDGETRIVVTILDVSERKKLEEELSEYRIQLEERVEERTKELLVARNEVQFKSDFMANMSHEIRTPMTAILGLLDIVLSADLNPKQKQYLLQIHNSSRALLHIINDILDISKIESGKLVIEQIEFSLLEALEGVVDLFAPSANMKDVSLHLKADLDIKTLVVGDRTRLTQVLSNLVGNSVKFTEKGHVVLNASCIERNESTITVQFKISDSGIGIDKKAMHRLFQAFEQADAATTRKFGGTGLGLAISQKLVGLMGGELRVTSEPGVGTNFWFDLELGVGKTEETKLTNFSDIGKRVLVVDDQEISREILNRMLSHWGCKVEVAPSAAKALEMVQGIENEEEQFELLVVDWRMPEMDGYTLVMKVREFYRAKGFTHEPSIIMVSEADIGEIQLSENFIKDIELINKPITTSRLLNTLSAVGLVDFIEKDATDEIREDLEAELVAELNGFESPLRVLLVEDNLTNQMVITELLSGYRLDITIAANGVQAVDYVKNEVFDLILMDLQMPKMDGLDVLKQTIAVGIETPMVMISGHGTIETAVEAIKNGAFDFISKPFDSVSLKSRASTHINYRNEVRSLEKGVGIDKLTGLATEAVFNEQGKKALAYAERHCAEVTLVRFELNKFAEMFVKYGKNVSEQILVKVAAIVEQGLREEDVAGRLGVAKFSLLLIEADVEGATQVVMRICQRLKGMKLKLGDDVIQLSFNAGLATFEKQDAEMAFEQLCDQADEALKKSVDAGDCQLVHYKTGQAIEEAPAIKNVESDIEDMIKKLSTDQSSVSQSELGSVLRKFIPVLEVADQQLKLGLSKVVPHLKKRLNLD